MTAPAGVRLSVCIPTYGRADCLRRAGRAFAEQIRADGLQGAVQLCVSDNHSPDATPDVVAALRARYPDVQVAYRRNDANLGAVRNVRRVVELAAGEFIALSGDDDLVNPGGLRCMLDACDFAGDVLLFNSLPGLGAWVRGLPPDDGTRRVIRDAHEANALLGIFHASFFGNVAF